MVDSTAGVRYVSFVGQRSANLSRHIVQHVRANSSTWAVCVGLTPWICRGLETLVKLRADMLFVWLPSYQRLALVRGVPPPCVIDVKKYMYICRELLKDERKEMCILYRQMITATHTYITVSLLQIISVNHQSGSNFTRHFSSSPSFSTNMIENLRYVCCMYLILTSYWLLVEHSFFFSPSPLDVLTICSYVRPSLGRYSVVYQSAEPMVCQRQGDTSESVSCFYLQSSSWRTDLIFLFRSG